LRSDLVQICGQFHRSEHASQTDGRIILQYSSAVTRECFT
jgi:hypothetical protein